MVLIHELVPRAGEGSKREQKRLVLVLSTDGQALKGTVVSGSEGQDLVMEGLQLPCHGY